MDRIYWMKIILPLLPKLPNRSRSGIRTEEDRCNFSLEPCAPIFHLIFTSPSYHLNISFTYFVKVDISALWFEFDSRYTIGAEWFDLNMLSMFRNQGMIIFRERRSISDRTTNRLENTHANLWTEIDEVHCTSTKKG